MNTPKPYSDMKSKGGKTTSLKSSAAGKLLECAHKLTIIMYSIYVLFSLEKEAKLYHRIPALRTSFSSGLTKLLGDLSHPHSGICTWEGFLCHIEYEWRRVCCVARYAVLAVYSRCSRSINIRSVVINTSGPLSRPKCLKNSRGQLLPLPPLLARVLQAHVHAVLSIDTLNYYVFSPHCFDCISFHLYIALLVHACYEQYSSCAGYHWAYVFRVQRGKS